MNWPSWLRAARPVDPAEAPDDASLASHVERLFPTDDATMSRTRGRLVAAARTASLDTARAPSGQIRRAPARRWAAPVAALAACLVLGAGLAAAQDGPGQPFYPVRLALESWSLPPTGTTARWGAELGYLGTRLQEVQAATARGDESAATAALDAYADQVDSAFRGGQGARCRRSRARRAPRRGSDRTRRTSRCGERGRHSGPAACRSSAAVACLTGQRQQGGQRARRQR